jgi:hypothetical protein
MQSPYPSQVSQIELFFSQSQKSLSQKNLGPVKKMDECRSASKVGQKSEEGGKY